jgi:hypothetical protein
MSPWYDRDDEETEPEITAAWFKKHGTLAVPPEHIRQAWQQGRTGLEPDRRTVARQHAMAKNGKNPQTGRWWPPWKSWKPSGGAAAWRRSLFRPGSERAKRAGRVRSYYKTLAARQNGRLGGQARSPRKTAAARINGRRGGLVRSLRKAECARRNGLRGGRRRAD